MTGKLSRCHWHYMTKCHLGESYIDSVQQWHTKSAPYPTPKHSPLKESNKKKKSAEVLIKRLVVFFFLLIIIQTQAFKELSKNPPVKCFVQHSVCNTLANGKSRRWKGELSVVKLKSASKKIVIWNSVVSNEGF